ncbi:MOSC domain-containing protein [Halonotius terrestris]|uniref:MOSC domain-containing protein n=1 Tax=Halonotius terrestris TaxID=2487750 RepID=A0A8J8TBP4_9EURY|nr:MOSC domain-containing protein [Halonotius terrestris]TQQ82575.1 MOSC domain-containing protein [Halonotius terrestris]
MAEVVDIYTAPDAGEPMEPREQIEAVEGGLVGDRYLRGNGYYSPYDVCEVTLVAGEALDTIREEYGIDLWDGRHRRNIVTRGVDLDDLLDATVRIGEAELRGTRPRPPCAHVEEVADEEGVARALGDERGGICASVTTPGKIAVGDEIEIVEADPQRIGAEIAARLENEAE